MKYDLLILGGGPAGAGAAVYASRKRLKTLMLTYEFGGQSTVSEGIENWIGTEKISGNDLAKTLKNHVLAYKADMLDLVEGVKVTTIAKTDSGFNVTTDDGKTYESRSVLIVTGSGRRKLEAENASEYENKGITYCASCDGPLFAGQNVVVIGGGNAGFETAAQLLAYCPSVTLLHRSDTYRADEVTVAKVLANPNMKAYKNVDVLKVSGSQFIESITFKDKNTNEETTLPTGGIFVEIGQIPNTDFVASFVTLNEEKKIVVDPMNQRTSVSGVWAAGDVTNGLYHQNNIAVGDAVKALEDIYMWLHKNK
ncbi:FAD-dependent oxidoreductase [Candidatus Nomurabacteria bacterium]|jgi:alkyl hydroperoxide reductase subunit F|nr:MAG: FAD-dependent oxidoreductase [Candidatus Nomurabacteria bacterium]